MKLLKHMQQQYLNIWNLNLGISIDFPYRSVDVFRVKKCLTSVEVIYAARRAFVEWADLKSPWWKHGRKSMVEIFQKHWHKQYESYLIMLAIDLFSCLLFVCFLSTAGAGDEWVNEWLGSKLQVYDLSTPPNLIHLSSSHQAFPDENCPKTKSETHFQNPFSRLFGFFWLGAPRFFPGFFTKWHESIASESEVQRGSAHSEGGTRSYRKDAAPEAIGMGKSTPSL